MFVIFCSIPTGEACAQAPSALFDPIGAMRVLEAGRARHYLAAGQDERHCWMTRVIEQAEMFGSPEDARAAVTARGGNADGWTIAKI